MSLKVSKLPKLSQLLYVVQVILFYMLEIKRMSRIEGLWSDCHAQVPLKCLEGGQWRVT